MILEVALPVFPHDDIGKAEELKSLSWSRWLWEKIHLRGVQRVLNTECLETALSVFVAGTKLMC